MTCFKSLDTMHIMGGTGRLGHACSRPVNNVSIHVPQIEFVFGDRHPSSKVKAYYILLRKKKKKNLNSFILL
jgi:hypothetical protein